MIPNFVRARRAEAAADDDPRLAALPAEPFILFVGDLSRDKGVHVLARAWRRLDSPPPLVLVGRRTDVEADVDQRDNGRLVVLPPIPRDLVLAIWDRCAIAVMPSVWEEPFGLVALEAMAAGRPVVASRVGFFRELIVDGECGLLAAPGDDESLARALARLIGDAALRERLGVAGRSRAAAFRAESIVPRFEAVYEREATLAS